MNFAGNSNFISSPCSLTLKETICMFVPPQRLYPTAGSLKLTGAEFNACARGDERGRQQMKGQCFCLHEIRCKRVDSYIEMCDLIGPETSCNLRQMCTNQPQHTRQV